MQSMSPNAAKINAKCFGVCHLQYATAFPFALPDPLPDPLPDFFRKKTCILGRTESACLEVTPWELGSSRLAFLS